MTYRARRSGLWGQGLRAPRRRECRSRASFCHEHRPRISLPWQPCHTPEGLNWIVRCSAAGLIFCEASAREFSAKARRFRKDQAAFLAPPASTSTPIRSLSFMMMYSTPSSLTCPRPLAEQHPVADLDVDRDELAALVATTRADGNDLPFLGFFLRGIRNDDAATRLLFSFDPLDDDAIVKWTEFHGLPPRRLKF